MSITISPFVQVTNPTKPDSSFKKEIETTSDNLQKLFYDFQLLAAEVYSLSSPDKLKKCDALQNEATNLTKQVAEYKEKLLTQQSKLFLLSKKQAKKARVKVQYSLLTLPFIEFATSQLKTRLDGEHYRKALSTCREKIKECEAKKNPETLFAETKKEIDAQKSQLKVTQKHLEIQSGAYALFEQTYQLFLKRMPESMHDSIKQEIAQLDPKRAISISKDSAVVQNGDEANFGQLLTDYINEFGKESLKPHLRFHQNSNAFTNWIDINFTKGSIKDVLQNLELVAKGIQRVHNDLQMTFSLFFTEDVSIDTRRKYEAAQRYLLAQLNLCKEQLFQKVNSAEVHAGLYYIDVLNRALTTLRQQILLLNELTKTENPLCKNAVKVQISLNNLIDIKETKKSPQYRNCQLKHLFDAACGQRSLQKIPAGTPPRSPNDSGPLARDVFLRTQSISENTITTIGQKIINKQCSGENDILSQLIHGLSFHKISEIKEQRSLTLPSIIEAYLRRNILQHLFFTSHPSGNIPKKNDVSLMIFILEHHPEYAEFFQESLKDTSFRKLIELYKTHCPDNFSAEFQLNLSRFFIKMNGVYRHQSNDTFSAVFPFAEAQLAYQKMIATGFQEARLNTVCQKLTEQAQQKFGLPEYQLRGHLEQLPGLTNLYHPENNQLRDVDKEAFKSHLFTTLTKALYALGDQKQGAETKLQLYFNLFRKSTDTTELASVKALLFVYLFKLNEKNPNTFVSAKLHDMMIMYLQDIKMQRALRSQIAHADLEQALYKSNLDTMIKQERGEKGYNEWKEGIEAFNLCLLHPEQKQGKLDRISHLITNLDEGAYKDGLKACQQAIIAHKVTD